MQLYPGTVGAACHAPYDGVVAYHARRRMVEGRHDGQRLALAQVDGRDDLLDLGRADDAAVDAEELVELGAQPQPVDGRLGVADVEPAHLVEQEVEPQLAGQALVELVALAEEGDRLGREVVRPDDGRAARACAAAEVVPVEHGHVGDAHLAQVVGRGQAVHPAADDHHVVGVLKGVPVPHLVLAEYHCYPCALPGCRCVRAVVPRGVMP